jgi:hypothetical protein
MTFPSSMETTIWREDAGDGGFTRPTLPIELVQKIVYHTKSCEYKTGESHDRVIRALKEVSPFFERVVLQVEADWAKEVYKRWLRNIGEGHSRAKQS